MGDMRPIIEFFAQMLPQAGVSKEKLENPKVGYFTRYLGWSLLFSLAFYFSKRTS
jgi:hypothetical protein